MLKNILGRNKNDSKADKAHDELIEKISNMNLTDMRAYVRDKLSNLPITEDGLNEVMLKLINEDKTTKKRYINDDDMDSKKKKAFDLVILVSSSKKLTVKTVELIQQFLHLYEPMINEYDKKNKDIYKSRLTDSLEKGINMMNQLAILKNKMNILGQN